MNKMFTIMLAYGFAIVTGFTCLAVHTPVYEEFKMTDQPFMFFKTFGKYPYAIHYDPAVNQLNTTFLGCIDEKTKEVVAPKKGSQLETLVPIRFTQNFVDANVKIDRKYKGWRESYIGQILESRLQRYGLIPTHTFDGVFMVNEYRLGI